MSLWTTGKVCRADPDGRAGSAASPGAGVPGRGCFSQVDLDLDGESGFDVAVELARSVSCVIILISTHALDDVQELVAGSPARGFLPKSALSARAIRELLGGDGEAPPA